MSEPVKTVLSYIGVFALRLLLGVRSDYWIDRPYDQERLDAMIAAQETSNDLSHLSDEEARAGLKGIALKILRETPPTEEELQSLLAPARLDAPSDSAE